MIPCKLLKQITVFFLLLTALPLQAQNMNESRWWAGIKSGIAFTAAHPSNQFSPFIYSGPATGTEKKYSTLFKGKGPLIAVSIDYAINEKLAISLQPAYQSYFFSYSSTYIWNDTAAQRLELVNTHRQKMHYLELPLLVKGGYSFGKVRVHLQAGAFYGTLLSAHKTINSSENFYDSTAVTSLNNFTESFNLSNLYIRSQIGIIAGAGISLDINYFRLALECNYRYGLNNITNVKNRYTDHRLISGMYDVPDDLNLRNLEIVLHCSTPLDYLMHMPGFSAKPARRKK